MGSKRFSFQAVLFSIIGAVIAFGVGELVLIFSSEWPSFFRVGLYFGLGAMSIAAMIFSSQKISPQLVGYRWKEMYYKNALKWYVPVTFVMVGIVAGILQFIYSLDLHEESVIKNIVIAIDNSSSMTDTDPNKERFNAISSMIDNLEGDKSVAIISFNDEPKLEIDFTKVKTDEQKAEMKQKIEALNIYEEEPTGVRTAMDMGFNMLNATGNKGSLILVSDGAPTDDSDIDIEGLVANYVDAKMPVYTIGMMYNNPDTIQYLEKIAELTEGVCYDTSDTTMLKEVYGKISYNEDKGTMITARSGAYVDSMVYKVMRIAFLMIVGLFVALGLGIMFDNKYLVKGMIVGSIVGGLVGSLILEFVMATMELTFLARFYFWGAFGAGLMAFTWCVTFKDSYHGTREA